MQNKLDANHEKDHVQQTFLWQENVFEPQIAKLHQPVIAVAAFYGKHQTTVM